MRRISIGTLVMALALSACGNAVDVEVTGKAAVTVDEAGNPLMVVQVCSGDIDTLVLARTREGLADDEPNKIEGTWTAPDPQSGVVEVSLTSATAGWDGPLIEPDTSRGYILEGTSSTADVVASQVTFTAEQLTSLNPDQVISGDGVISDRLGFESGACAPPE